MARKAISKKVRFEVFKRDNFCCQYCGKGAPEVILHIDHIKPVSRGGKNDILNLVTSCRDCNLGKGARELSDDSAVSKQRRQLEELNERREQLDMVVRWREELNAIKDKSVEAVHDAIETKTIWALRPHCKEDIRKWLRKYSLAEILAAVDSAFDQYIEFDADGDETSESFNKAYRYIPRIAAVNRRATEKPYLKDLFYIRGICRNRWKIDQVQMMERLEAAHLRGASISDLKAHAISDDSLPTFEGTLDYYMIHGDGSET